MKKIAALLGCLFCICMLLPCVSAGALSAQNSLTLHYYATNEALPLANAQFDIYLVAVPNDESGYTLTEAFQEYAVDLSELDWNEAGRLTELAVTLSAYAVHDQIPPLYTDVTDERGDLTFHGLEDGLYLVWGDVLTVEVGDTEWNFTPQPLLLPLPYIGEDGSAVRDMEVDVKYDRFPPPTMDDLIDLTVKKAWKAEGEHPSAVTVQLMRNGIVTDSAVLNEENDWQHTWEDLNSGYVWQVIEADIPMGYTVSVHQEGYTFTITNTESDSNSSSDEVVTTSAAETTGQSTTNTTAVQTASTGKTTVTTEEKLPQTGQLWWPVPLLAGAGLLMIGTGMLLRREEK